MIPVIKYLAFDNSLVSFQANPLQTIGQQGTVTGGGTYHLTFYVRGFPEIKKCQCSIGCELSVFLVFLAVRTKVKCPHFTVPVGSIIF